MPERARDYYVVTDDHLKEIVGDAKPLETQKSVKNWIKANGVEGETYRIMSLIQDPITIEVKKIRKLIQ